MITTTIDTQLGITVYEPQGEYKGIVIILGWLGSVPRYTKKYAEMYVQEGYIAITFIAPPWFGFLPFLRPKITVPFLQRLSKFLEGRSGKIIWHGISNNGGFALSAFIQYLQGIENKDPTNKLVRIKHRTSGVILDSAPSRLEHSVGMAAVSEGLRPNFVVKAVIHVALWISVGISVLLNKLKGINGPPHEHYWKWLAPKQCPWPYLFVYSQTDQIVPYNHVDEFIDRLRSENKDRLVVSKKWNGPRHVEILKNRSEEYRDTIIYQLSFDAILKEHGDKV